MVTRKNIRSHALISVYNKSNLNKICLVFKKYNIGIISTGSTAKKIKDLGFKCQQVSELTKTKEMLNGRVKTLNHKIHASILFNRKKKDHIKKFQNLKFPKIDYVIVNFYPFNNIYINKNKLDKIETIDIGGPAMIRSASKNFDFVTTLCSIKYYKELIDELNMNNGSTSLKFRVKMAKNNFKETSAYDRTIYRWFNKNSKKEKTNNKIKIKYGENPNQKAFFISNSKQNIINSQISGKKIGYNNILDISDGLNCLKEFKDPTCVIIKHNNPCGVASTNNVEKSFIKAYNSDPVSAFGGIILFNRIISEKLALKIISYFSEAVVAPRYTKKALEVLKSKNSLIVVNSKNIKKENNLSFRSVNSGILYQDTNNILISQSKLKLVSKVKSSKKTIDDLVFAYKVAKHVKSNAVVLVGNKQTLGIGAGQMSRLDSTSLAIRKYKKNFNKKNFVCASDAFFPFTDNLKILHKKNCLAIVQPYGSINDKKIINYANKSKISLYFSQQRVFKH